MMEDDGGQKALSMALAPLPPAPGPSPAVRPASCCVEAQRMLGADKATSLSAAGYQYIGISKRGGGGT